MAGKYAIEIRDRAVELALSSNRLLRQLADEFGVHREALAHLGTKAQADRGQRPRFRPGARPVPPTATRASWSSA